MNSTYRDIQYRSRWFFAGVGVLWVLAIIIMVAFSRDVLGWPVWGSACALATLMPVIVLCQGRQIITADSRHLTVRRGWLWCGRRSFDMGEVRDLKVCICSRQHQQSVSSAAAVANHICFLNMGRSRGVRFVYRDRLYVIGSCDPSRLVSIIAPCSSEQSICAQAARSGRTSSPAKPLQLPRWSMRRGYSTWGLLGPGDTAGG